MTARPRTPTTHPHAAPSSAGARALRRDTARFLQALGSYDPDRPTRATALAAWFEAAATTIRQGQPEDLEAAIVAATGAVRQLAEGGPGDREVARRAAEDAVVRLRAILLEQLDDPAGTSISLPHPWVRHRGPRSWARHQGGGGGPAFALCWYLDAATSAERADVWQTLPATVRLRYRVTWRRRYERLVAVLGVSVDAGVQRAASGAQPPSRVRQGGCPTVLLHRSK